MGMHRRAIGWIVLVFDFVQDMAEAGVAPYGDCVPVVLYMRGHFIPRCGKRARESGWASIGDLDALGLRGR